MSGNIFRDTLAKSGITNGLLLAERMQCPAVILFFGGDRLPVPYAELRYWDARGREQKSVHLPRHPNTMTMPAMRRKTVEEAQQKAQAALGLAEWTRSPFPNCWMPTGVLKAARERYMDDVEESAKTA